MPRKRILIIAVLLLIGIIAVLLVSAIGQTPETGTAVTQTAPDVGAQPPTSENTRTAEPSLTPAPLVFDGQRAMADVEYQVSLGPRLPGSTAHAQAVDWMLAELQNAGWSSEVQETERMGHPIRNVIGKRGQGETWLIIGAHYDSRFWADEDPDPNNHRQPVPGANDGASGVGVLLELARTLPADLDKQIWLVFFDTEDQGRIPDWDWILGSRAFVDALESIPDAVMVIDMIGDADLNIYMERNSDPELTQSVWAKAAELGYSDQFIPEPRHAMLDDHTPFIERGIPSVLLIDFDYPYWHTLEDTPDKISPQSLQAVGDTVTAWLLEY
jgi:glutaminyl-peptide cyclotransferase